MGDGDKPSQVLGQGTLPSPCPGHGQGEGVPQSGPGLGYQGGEGVPQSGSRSGYLPPPQGRTCHEQDTPRAVCILQEDFLVCRKNLFDKITCLTSGLKRPLSCAQYGCNNELI